MSTVDQQLGELRQAFREEHLDLGRQLLDISSKIYFPDMFIVAAMKRSLSLMRGFADLIESRNYMSAAPLVRLQLDNALRAAALAMVTNPHEFAEKVLAGTSIRDLTDRNGKKLTDHYLTESLSTQWPWIKAVYSHGSGYVHFSGQHILVTFRGKDGAPSDSFAISEDNELVPDEAYVAASNAFASSTFVFLRYVEAWIREKIRTVEDERAGKCIHRAEDETT